VATRAGYRAIRLPYAVRALGMVIVLPDEVDGVDAVAGRLEQDELSGLFAELRRPDKYVPVALALPRFKAAYGADLIAPFMRAGMKLAFDDRNADFSGMTGRPPIEGGVFIGAIIHRAVIEATEESTEAAAATAVVMMPLRAAPRPQTPEVFRVDRPFLFYVVDNATGAILFQGRIADPR
jgi:serpin B